ncbi:MAG: bifunctional phosphoglucose/phosphomannose isomerase [Candidatus Omnitrophica bacterium]|nr:bifunctional phosphoglucose/phosphomannose isomerase [Candidatus Omnitrophota bacterium]
MNRLDDLESIRKIDASEMAALLSDFPRQCQEGVNRGENARIPAGLKSFIPSAILFSGLGGSAITGDLIADLIREEAKFPILVNRDYSLPRFVDKKTLVFCISYSGNTEETIASYQESHKRGAKVIVISSGGKLTKLARSDKIFSLCIPGGFPPRAALGFLFFSALTLFQRLNLIKNRRREVKETLSLLAKFKEELSFNIPFRKNRAKRIAEKLKGKMPIIYASNRLAAVALRFQTQLAENSKQFASRNLFPEMNHNEIMGWNNPLNLLRNFFIIFLRDKGDYKRIKSRMDITRSLLSKYPAGTLEINTKGNGVLARNFSTLYLCDWISFYLSILNKIDPTPVERITLLKKKLAEL